ncbi:hypothetical protein KGI01_03950 [Kurthia gibsonii]|nr:hypothetical protein KGI01_03950 [Kurthia gibsonii]
MQQSKQSRRLRQRMLSTVWLFPKNPFTPSPNEGESKVYTSCVFKNVQYSNNKIELEKIQTIKLLLWDESCMYKEKTS